jgi:hypothetical protein
MKPVILGVLVSAVGVGVLAAGLTRRSAGPPGGPAGGGT